jgi:hypothetical protein
MMGHGRVSFLSNGDILMKWKVYLVIVVFLISCKVMGQEANDLWKFYKKTDEFKTLVPLVLMYSDDGLPGRRLVLAVPRDIHEAHLNWSLTFAAPRSVDINESPKCLAPDSCLWKQRDIVELIPAGSKISMSRMVLYRKGVRWNPKVPPSEQVVAFAKVQTIKRGTVEVDIQDLSEPNLDVVIDGKNYDVPGPKSELIEKIEH